MMVVVQKQDYGCRTCGSPFDQVALMPDAHGGYGMPIGGILLAGWAAVP